MTKIKKQQHYFDAHPIKERIDNELAQRDADDLRILCGALLMRALRNGEITENFALALTLPSQEKANAS